MEEGFLLMPARVSPSSAIAKRDLEACTDIPSLFALFRSLRYPVEDVPVAVPFIEGDLPGSLRDEIVARYPVTQIGGNRAGSPLVTVTLFLLKDFARKSDAIRSIAQAWTRRFPGEHLLVFAIRDQPAGTIEQLAFVNTRQLGDGAHVRIKLHKLLVDRRNPTRHDLDTLNHIALPSDNVSLSAEQVYQVQCAAFDVEQLTNTFYREYAQRFRKAQERIKEDNPTIAAFVDPTRLHTFTQRLFGRLMFLYFLQKKKGRSTAIPSLSKAGMSKQSCAKSISTVLYLNRCSSIR